MLSVMAEHDLRRGQNGLQVYVMCEIPSNVILTEGLRAALTDSPSAATILPNWCWAWIAIPPSSPSCSMSATQPSST